MYPGVRDQWSMTNVKYQMENLALLQSSDLLQSQEQWQIFRRAPDRPRQAQFRHIVGEDAVDVVELRSGRRFLGLHDLDVIAHSGVETLPRQVEVLQRRLNVLQRHPDLAGRRLHVEEGVAHFTLYLLPDVFEFGAPDAAVSQLMGQTPRIYRAAGVKRAGMSG